MLYWRNKPKEDDLESHGRAPPTVNQPHAHVTGQPKLTQPFVIPPSGSKVGSFPFPTQPCLAETPWVSPHKIPQGFPETSKKNVEKLPKAPSEEDFFIQFLSASPEHDFRHYAHKHNEPEDQQHSPTCLMTKHTRHRCHRCHQCHQ